MFAMGSIEAELENSTPRDKSIILMSQLLANLTGRWPSPEEVGQVVDSFKAYINHTVVDEIVADPTVPAEVKKVVKEATNGKPS